jgi:hypothetical protein
LPRTYLQAQAVGRGRDRQGEHEDETNPAIISQGHPDQPYHATAHHPPVRCSMPMLASLLEESSMVCPDRRVWIKWTTRPCSLHVCIKKVLEEPLRTLVTAAAAAAALPCTERR